MIRREAGMLRGAIDLLWEDADGELHIVDWKTGSFDPERHKAQIRDYVSAVTQATGKRIASASLFFAMEGKASHIEMNV
jgi:ATP-dependent exoDNAse (exonuclease V) beta subunit